MGTTTTLTPSVTTTTTTILQSNPASVTTTNATLGLNFTLTLSSTQLGDGQPVSITATVTNIRSTFNNITAESDWSEGWFIGWGAIDSCNSFANAQIFQGYYTQSNISSLQPGVELQLANPALIPECPFIPGAWHTYFPFQPYESQVGYHYSISGDYGPVNSTTTFHFFAPGVYTVAAGDEWGQMVILHFTVGEISNQTTNEPISFVQGSASICADSCNYPSPYLSAEVLVDSTSPLRSLQLYVNGTYESTSSYSNNFTTAYVIQYKANPTNQTLPIVSGKAYKVTLIATFQDKSISSASTVVVASSVPVQSSIDLVCVTTNYQVLGIESMTLQNGTTIYLPVSTTTRTTVGTTVTTTTNVTETVSYVTATTSYSPPSSWTVVACTYVK